VLKQRLSVSSGVKFGCRRKGKFAEGGQAELLHAHVTWAYPKENETDLEAGIEWVLKVFKKGTLLRCLQLQWPEGYLKVRVERLACARLGKPVLHRYNCELLYGTLLEDGRFGFLMVKEDKDLRNLIDRKMETNSGNSYGSFHNENECVEMLM
jgi:hypothetical protein